MVALSPELRAELRLATASVSRHPRISPTVARAELAYEIITALYDALKFDVDADRYEIESLGRLRDAALARSTDFLELDDPSGTRPG